MQVQRGEVFRTLVPIPPRPGPGDPTPTNKRVVALRTSDDREADVPCALLSTDHHPDDPPRAAYEVKIGANAAWGTDAASKVDCRWIFTLSKENLNPSLGLFPEKKMEEINVALVVGLQMA